MNHYTTSDFGKAKFKIKLGRIVEAFGTITKINGEYVIFEDNDNFSYKIDKNDFEFEKHEKEIKL